MSKLKLAFGVALALGLSGAAYAQTIVFDPDGTAGGFGAVELNAMDPLPGNALAVGAVPLSVGAAFTTYFQSEISQLLTNGGNIALPTGAAGPFELTLSGALNEVVSNAIDTTGDGVPDIVTFDHTGGTISIYYDDFSGGTINADGTTGNSGLGYADGKLILQATVNPQLLGATYTLQNADLDGDGVLEPVIEPLDQFGSDDLGVDSLVGNGSSSLTADVTFFDPDFFLTPPDVISLAFDGTFTDPFDSVNPEQSVGGQVPQYGPDNINGLADGGVVQDYHFETDGNLSFHAQQQVPEPGSLALLSLGAFGLAGIQRRNRSFAA